MSDGADEPEDDASESEASSLVVLRLAMMRICAQNEVWESRRREGAAAGTDYFYWLVTRPGVTADVTLRCEMTRSSTPFT